jgi:hypothetical protein
VLCPKNGDAMLTAKLILWTHGEAGGDLVIVCLRCGASISVRKPA